jgi:hypothetical protein
MEEIGMSSNKKKQQRKSQQSLKRRKEDEDKAIQASSAEEFADQITHDLGPPSTMGRIEDDEEESGENYALPFGD